MMPDKENEFDDLVRAAAENHNSSGASPDWDKMEQMLEKHLPVEKNPRRRLWFILIPLLFLLGGAYVYTTINAKKAILKEQPADAAKDKAVLPAATKPVKNPVPAAGLGEAKDRSLKEKTTSIAQSQSSSPDLKTVAGSSNGIAAAASSTDTKNVTNKSIYPKGKNKGIKDKKAGNIKTVISAGDLAENSNGSPAATEAPSPGKNNLIDKTNAIDTFLQNKIADSTTAIPAEKPVLTEPSIAKTSAPAAQKNKPVDKKSKTTVNKKNPFEISLVYALELTTIRFTNLEKPGSNYGILLGYAISNRISIQSGVLKSRKNYIADGADYKLSYMVPAPFKLTSVKGYCNMYEIPVNVKYQLSQNKNLSVSLSAGLSSYIMTHESYTYRYNSNDSAYSRNRSYGSQKNYWFSLATVAVGFEREISKKLTIGAAPFIKIPFKGMGTGELRLLGTGINFSLSYRPAFRK